MLNYLVAFALILIALLGWIWIQQLARNYAARHPELGPAKEEGEGCGSGRCGSCDGSRTSACERPIERQRP
ncbi:chemotaxis protein [Thiogranum longum]